MTKLVFFSNIKLLQFILIFTKSFQLVHVTENGEHFPELIVVRCVLEPVAEDLSFEVVQIISIVEADVFGFLYQLDIADESELLVDVHSWSYIDTWKMPLFEKVHHKIKHLNEVISATC